MTSLLLLYELGVQNNLMFQTDLFYIDLFHLANFVSNILELPNKPLVKLTLHTAGLGWSGQP